MKLTIEVEHVGERFYTKLVEELANHANCVVIKDREDVIVQTEGDIVTCSCVVAICDKYRFSGELTPLGTEDKYEKRT